MNAGLFTRQSQLTSIRLLDWIVYQLDIRNKKKWFVHSSVFFGLYPVVREAEKSIRSFLCKISFSFLSFFFFFFFGGGSIDFKGISIRLRLFYPQSLGICIDFTFTWVFFVFSVFSSFCLFSFFVWFVCLFVCLDGTLTGTTRVELRLLAMKEYSTLQRSLDSEPKPSDTVLCQTRHILFVEWKSTVCLF